MNEAAEGSEPAALGSVDVSDIKAWYKSYKGRASSKLARDLTWLVAADTIPIWFFAFLIASASSLPDETQRAHFMWAFVAILFLGIVMLVVGILHHRMFQSHRNDVETLDRHALTNEQAGEPRQAYYFERYIKAIKRRLSGERVVNSAAAASLIVALLAGIWFGILGMLSQFQLIEHCQPGEGDRRPTMESLCIIADMGFTGAMIFFAHAAVMIIFWKHVRDRINELVERLLEYQLRQDLISTTVTDTLQRNAFKLLKLNEYELGKYYRLNLRQNATVFVAGFAAMALGFVIIGITLYIVSTTRDDAQLIIAIFGGVGALLTNFVAAIYLHMHGKSSEAMIQLHKRLAESNDLFLANMLASSIDDQPKRFSALADLAQSIGGRTSLAK